MPFTATHLTALSGANGFTLWHYRTTDSQAEVQAANYFAPASQQMRAGDIVMLQAADATMMLPIRAGNFTGTGVTLDAAGASVEIRRSANLPTDAATSWPQAAAMTPKPNSGLASQAIKSEIYSLSIDTDNKGRNRKNVASWFKAFTGTGTGAAIGS